MKRATHVELDDDGVFHSTRRKIYIPDDIDTAEYIFDYQPSTPDEVARPNLQGRTLFIDGLSGRKVSFEEARRLTDGFAKVFRDRFDLGWDDVLAVFSPSTTAVSFHRIGIKAN
jgi:hypothetical protein